MIDKYFSAQYARMNNIDLMSDESIRLNYENSIPYFDRELLPYIGNFKDKKILDAGCGIGKAIYYLSQKGCGNIEGVDQSLEQISILKKFISSNVYNDSLENFLGGKENHYDIIIMYDVIEHIQKENIFNLLSLLFKSLKEGGRIVVRTPNMGHLAGNYFRYNDFTHHNGFTDQSLIQIFANEAFKNINCYNSYIGKKRSLILNLVNKFFKWLYNTKISEIVTDNIILIAEK